MSFLEPWYRGLNANQIKPKRSNQRLPFCKAPSTSPDGQCNHTPYSVAGLLNLAQTPFRMKRRGWAPEKMCCRMSAALVWRVGERETCGEVTRALTTVSRMSATQWAKHRAQCRAVYNIILQQYNISSHNAAKCMTSSAYESQSYHALYWHEVDCVQYPGDWDARLMSMWGQACFAPHCSKCVVQVPSPLHLGLQQSVHCGHRGLFRSKQQSG